MEHASNAAPGRQMGRAASHKMFHLINDMLEHCLPSVERATIPMGFENPQAFNEGDCIHCNEAPARTAAG